MISTRRWRLVALAILGLSAACSKGATTLDRDANEAAASNGLAGSDADDDSRCGNEQIDDGEDCDGALLDGVTCINLGFTGGTLACRPDTCLFETSMCTRPPSSGAGGDGG